MNNKPGGVNTNINGLNFENKTFLPEDKIGNFIRIKKNNFRKYMKKINEKSFNVKEGHGCKEPDEIYIDVINKILIIIEKKFQNVGGSVCEKLQTCNFKKFNYEKQYPNYKVNLIYVLSKWFIYNCETELEYLEENNFTYYIGSENNYKEKISEYIINCK